MCLTNVIEYYAVAIQINQADLKSSCAQFITDNTEAVINTKEFLDCDTDTLKGILQIDELSCKETTVFNACIKWAKTNCLSNGLDSELSNLRSQLASCFHNSQYVLKLPLVCSRQLNRMRSYCIFCEQNAAQCSELNTMNGTNLLRNPKNLFAIWQNAIFLLLRCRRNYHSL